MKTASEASASLPIPESTLLVSLFGTPQHQGVQGTVGNSGWAFSLIPSSHTLLSLSPSGTTVSNYPLVSLLKHELPCQPPPGDRFKLLIPGPIPWVLQSFQSLSVALLSE